MIYNFRNTLCSSGQSFNYHHAFICFNLFDFKTNERCQAFFFLFRAEHIFCTAWCIDPCNAKLFHISRESRLRGFKTFLPHCRCQFALRGYCTACENLFDCKMTLLFFHIYIPYDGCIIWVPIPSSVKISSRSECLMRPSIMWTLFTPASSVANAERTFGIIPL